MKSIVVIYHSADFDGLFCREIARKFYGASADYLGWDYKDPPPIITPEVAEIIMLDISIDGLMDDPRLTWIDHHKTAMDKFSPAIRGFRIDGVAACRLAWQWFFTWNIARNITADHCAQLPMGLEFKARTVQEPYAVRLAGEYDIWDKRDANAELFQHGLRSQELTDHVWTNLLDMTRPCPDVTESTNSELMVSALLQSGHAIQFSMRENAKRVCEGSAFEIEWEGLKWLALNTGGNSLTFASAEQPHHDGLLMFRWAKDRWLISLYHSQAHTERDLSAIATKYGGGGHRGACGFNCKTLPFELC